MILSTPRILVEFHGMGTMIEYYEFDCDTPNPAELATGMYIRDGNKWEWVEKIKIEIEVSND